MIMPTGGYMLARLHVIISSEKDNDINKVKEALIKINPLFSISPARPYAMIKDHSELFITFNIEQNQIQPLLDQLNNDWTGEIDSCQCYGFNTKMFDSLVYCLEFDIFN